jgi:uncharacterized damage-inducible protein DinB
MKAHFSMMAGYNAWANARLYAAARSLPDKAYRKNVGAFFGSLHGTLNHLMVTDRIWMRRFTGVGDHPDKLNAIMFDDLVSLEVARKEEDIDKDLSYATTKGVPYRNRLGDVLAHLFNHQTHHRGQAHTILTVLGIPEPRPLDLLGMFRKKA